ncbi:MAG: FAD-dependent oxidoreductase [Deltaproteobacteria bacterium]|nr:FAD-dependent oxidoreductase [Deltaproteobacteria bacterium]
MPHFPALAADETADVCVVGAGITGLTAALLLRRAGLDVCVLEQQRIGAGTTGGSSAHLTVVTDMRWPELRTRDGEAAARAAVQANRLGIERVAKLDAELGDLSSVQRVPGYLWARHEKDQETIETIIEGLVKCGEPAQWHTTIPLPGGAAGLRVDNQAMFQPMLYLAGLARLCAEAGVRIYEDTRMTTWESPATATTPNGTVTAKQLVLATHMPPGFVPTIQTRAAPFMSYLIEVSLPSPLADGLYWDLDDPYHYIRPVGGNRVIIGGADHRPTARDPFECLVELERWSAERMSHVGVHHKWAEMFFEPADGLPYIGQLAGHDTVWVATGMSGTGLTWGSYAAERITAGIQGQVLPMDDVFSPRRLAAIASADHVVAEQLDVAWRMIADRLRPTGDLHPRDLAPGEGRILGVDGRKAAVWRDESGELHLLSPVCRHLGCLVGWNPLDKTWDCGCHGGRYAADGTRIYGPPQRDLERRKLD